MPSFLRIGMQVVLETGEQHAEDAAGLHRRPGADPPDDHGVDDGVPARRRSGADLAEDLASLVIALSDGMIVGSQIYPDWEPGQYVDLLAGMIAAIADSAR